jgi:phosphomevalonate kinase
MTEEQQFKTKALSQGMEALKAEYRNRMDRETDSYHQAVFQILLNVDETWRAKNEKSFFETELDKVDNGFGVIGCRIPIGNTKGEVFLAPVDNITDHVVERWKPEINEWYWKLRDTGVPLELKWTGTKQDWDYYHYGNCFRTNAEAVAARDMVKKALLG